MVCVCVCVCVCMCVCVCVCVCHCLELGSMTFAELQQPLRHVIFLILRARLRFETLQESFLSTGFNCLLYTNYSWVSWDLFFHCCSFGTAFDLHLFRFTLPFMFTSFGFHWFLFHRFSHAHDARKMGERLTMRSSPTMHTEITLDESTLFVSLAYRSCVYECVWHVHIRVINDVISAQWLTFYKTNPT